jgi:hypothetical protein
LSDLSDSSAALFVLACTFGGALIGMRISRVLPEHHLSDQSRDTVKLATGMIATITALVLGLVTASAKSEFDAADDAIGRGAADILMLDRALARYGPETAGIREAARENLVARLQLSWPEEHSAVARPDGTEVMLSIERIVDRIGELSPDSDQHRRLRAEALDLGNDVMHTRWRVLQNDGNSIPRAFLVVLVCWLTLIFTSFGLLAPRNVTTVGVIFLCAMSVAAAVFLILEMAAPFDGMMKVSSGPMRYALEHLGR